MAQPKDPNLVRWENYQKRKTDRINRKEARRRSVFLKNVCKATAHVQDDNTKYYATFDTDPSVKSYVGYVTYTCSRCCSQVKTGKTTGLFYTGGSVIGLATGRIKSTRTP